MEREFDNSWLSEIFTSEELKQNATFEAAMKEVPGKEITFEKGWFSIIEKVKSNIDQDPKSTFGINIAKDFINLVNYLYGKKYAHLRNKKFEKGFCQGKGLEPGGLTLEIVFWLKEAMEVYLVKRIHNVLSHVGKVPENEVLSLWNEILDEHYGEDLEARKSIFKFALNEKNISLKAKKWLKAVQL